MILINNVYWKLAFVTPNFPLLQRFNGEYSIGACDSLTRTIYISQGLSEPLFKKVLCHQIVHAAMFSYGINLSYEQEELLADLISTYGEQIVFITNKIFTKLYNKGVMET